MRISHAPLSLVAVLALSAGLTACTTNGPAPLGEDAVLSSSELPLGSAGGDSIGDGLGDGQAPGVPVGSDEPQPVRGEVRVVGEPLPHDSTLFTQGLQVVGEEIYESTGRVGQSIIQRRPLAGGPPEAEVSLDADHFGEGLAHTGDRVWNLTWTSGVAYDRDPATLEERDRVHYEGEGWGLCYDGNRLIMTDGTPEITFRDPVTFDVLGTQTVTAGGKPVQNLNELDCSHEEVVANVWLTDELVRFSPDDGIVSHIYDASHLHQPRPEDADAVFNGVTALPGSDNYLVTGKLWNEMYEVELVG